MNYLDKRIIMFHHLDLIKTLLLNRRVKSKQGGVKVHIYHHTTVDIASGTQILINRGVLSINKSWNKKGSLFPFLFYVGQGGAI